MECQHCGAPVTYRQGFGPGLGPVYDTDETDKLLEDILKVAKKSECLYVKLIEIKVEETIAKRNEPVPNTGPR